MKIGILALQGNFYLHKKALNYVGVDTTYIRTVDDLSKCDSLIIPGGESTTMSLLIKELDLFDAIKKFSTTHTLFGTCAGAILMSQCIDDDKVLNFNCINVKSIRNSWGSQIDSFKAEISLCKDFSKRNIEGSFIRAPKFIKNDNNCKVLGRYKKEDVLIRNNNHLISSFHPELDINFSLPIYEYYLNMINE